MSIGNALHKSAEQVWPAHSFGGTYCRIIQNEVNVRTKLFTNSILNLNREEWCYGSLQRVAYMSWKAPSRRGVEIRGRAAGGVRLGGGGLLIQDWRGASLCEPSRASAPSHRGPAGAPSGSEEHLINHGHNKGLIQRPDLNDVREEGPVEGGREIAAGWA